MLTPVGQEEWGDENVLSEFCESKLEGRGTCRSCHH
jgi:hypothetical protein